MGTSAKESRVGRWTGYDAVRFALGAVLLAAAVLKAHQLATGPVAETNLLHSRWFLMIEVEFELLFGLWLLAGARPRPTWTAALLLFIALAGVSLYQIVSGEASCGCFGKVPVNPWFTFAFDVVAVMALLCWRPPGRSTPAGTGGRFQKLRPLAVVALWLIVGIPAAIAMGSYTPTAVNSSGDILGEDSLVVLDPETWVGKPFPLSKHVDVGERLAEGKWIVLLYHLAVSRATSAPEVGRLSSLIEEMTRSFSAVWPNSALSPIVRAGLFGLAMSAAGQIGDLIESCFKRDADIKDSGRILPRFGGILDLVDSPVISMPVAWLLLTIVWNLV